ncbi:MAG: chloride channel protein [Atopobiaceae bacterium]|nr:chloride channel protein [Atopobiaceae bacterium]
MKRNELRNELRFLLFCALIGATAGVVFWLFLFAMQQGTWLVWNVLPQEVASSMWYSVAVCGVGGLLLGLLHRRFGDYPEPMADVFARIKRTGTYPYKNILAIILMALIPLLIGSSVGPEAAMVGIMAALCCWAGENLRFAGAESAYYSKIGASVGLSVMFRSPLFGVFEVEEGDEESGLGELSRSGKAVAYCVAAGAGFGCFSLLSRLFGGVASGFPSYEVVQGSWLDVLLFVPYVAFGVAFGLFFLAGEHGFDWLGNKLPTIACELGAGIVLGVVTALLPAVRFSGETQIEVLMGGGFGLYAPLAVVGVAFAKVLLTNMCTGLGLRGGHFFPLIFASACFGTGLSELLFGGDVAHATIAAAVVAAATLATTMKKPFAVAMLLMLCFPARMLGWIVPAAAVGAWVSQKIKL